MFESKVKSLLNLVETNYWNEVERIRINNAEILYNFYRNNTSFIVEMLKNRMTKKGKGLFKKETIEKFVTYNFINPLPKILNLLCNIYSEEPTRKIYTNDILNEIETNKMTAYINNTFFNTKMLELHKLAKLFGSILLMPIIVDGKIKHKILYPFQVAIETYEYDAQKIKQIGILDYIWNEENKTEERIIHVWNQNEYYILDSDLNKINYAYIGGEKKELSNPYGRIPIENLTLITDEYDFWDESWLNDIENIIDLGVINIVMSYYSFFFTGGNPVLIDYELENLIDTSKEIGIRINDKIIGYKKEAPTLRIAPDSIINLKNNTPDTKADFKYVTPQTNISELKEYFDWKRKLILSNRGISPNAFNLERIAQSGYAKQMEETETIQLRKQDISKLRDFENRYFELIKLIAEVQNLDEYKFPKDSKLVIDYPEITFPKSNDEIAKEIETMIKYNIKNPIDFIREYNPDLTIKEAEEIYNKNKEINAMQETKDITLNLTPEENYIMLEFPDLRQDYDFTCGASCLQSVLMYYGFDAVESELVQKLGATADWGTEHTDIIRVAKEYGLEVESGEFSIEQVKNYIEQKIPVILDIQAWSEKSNIDYSLDYDDGHYIVAIGYDDNGFIIEDPSDFGRQYMTFEELQKRWHDIDKNNNKLNNLGIAIIGSPKYTKNQWREIK